ncbi:carboxylate-amine ligase [Rhodobacterales bacterium 52_120_T64]|nr:carboxylate-amine ligase [Rhodobacterales bacterium 52_120_T64]
MIAEPTLTLGIEEEYLIVDRKTRDLVREPDAGFLAACADLLGEQVTGEYLQCQVEVGTKPHKRVRDAREDLVGLRKAISAAAEAFDYAPIAASTHPFANWREQTHTRKERYDALRDDLGLPVRRMLICGMHMHIGIEDEDLRIDLMNQATYFLPHLLALSCSSPFWEGEDTGLASCRLTVFDALPRTGLPDVLGSYGEYTRMVGQLVKVGCIEDSSKIWWDIRPSSKFPTIEQRVTDVCSLVDDVAAIAAVYQSIMSFLFRLRKKNQRWRVYPQTLILENRWQAQRNGAMGRLIDHGRGELVPMSELMEELIEMIGEDAERLACSTELARAKAITLNGNSADRQRVNYKAALDDGANPHEASIVVVDGLIEEYSVS